MMPQHGDFVQVDLGNGTFHKGRVEDMQDGVVVYRVNGRRRRAAVNRCEITLRPKRIGASRWHKPEEN